MIEFVKDHKIAIGGAVVIAGLAYLYIRNNSDSGASSAGAFSGVNYNDVPVGTSLLTFGSSGALSGGANVGKQGSTTKTGGITGTGKSGGGVHVTGSNVSTSDGFKSLNAAAIAAIRDSVGNGGNAGAQAITRGIVNTGNVSIRSAQQK